jgi:hypothetical protein
LIRSQSWHARVLPSTCHAHRQCGWPLHATRACTASSLTPASMARVQLFRSFVEGHSSHHARES